MATPTLPDRVLNMDISGLVQRIDKIIYEIHKAMSANITMIAQHDMTRLTTYGTMLDTYVNWIVSDANDVDIPEAYPTGYPIDYISNDLSDAVENLAAQDLIRMYRTLMVEMVLSQSARMSHDMLEPDEGRYRLLRGKIDAYITNYVDNVQPLDVPESTPVREHTGAGHRDPINPPNSSMIK